MENLYNRADAEAFISKFGTFPEALALRVYTSRLLGRNDRLVLHGGGNTSVKLKQINLVGEEREVIYVKGSGKDMALIGPEGFSGLDLKTLKKLCRLESLDDADMEEQLEVNRISVHSPDPSVEALLHVFLPHTYIDHTHADSILMLSNQKDGAEKIREALGDSVVVMPYFMSGFQLAKKVFSVYKKNVDIDAIVVVNHGIFTFSEDAKTSYDNMIELASRAEQYIQQCMSGKTFCKPDHTIETIGNRDRLASKSMQIVRGACAHAAFNGRLKRFYGVLRTEPDIIAASLSEQAKMICQSGVLTPDHVIRTKNHIIYLESVPEEDEELKKTVTEKVTEFKKNYEEYFARQTAAKETGMKMLDPYPRLFLLAGIGLAGLGATRYDADVAADIGARTIMTKYQSGLIESYQPISEGHIFDMEYWDLQLKKLDKELSLPLQGQVAVITGGAGAIGFGIAKCLLESGAAVVMSDIDRPGLEKVHSHLVEITDENRVDYIDFDVTDYASVEQAFEKIGRRFGGIDLLVPNAGVAHVAKIENIDPEKLDQVIDVNLKGTFNVIKAAIPIFKRQGTGGNIVVISSKNVFDPGASFGAYSAGKAGAHQLSKIAAMELAEFGVKVNMINPDAVFGDEKVSSKMWDLIGPDRMKSRGLDPEGLKDYYRQRNLLKERVLAKHVGNAVVFFASDLIPTTGATLPVDGGIPAAFPR